MKHQLDKKPGSKHGRTRNRRIDTQPQGGGGLTTLPKGVTKKQALSLARRALRAEAAEKSAKAAAALRNSRT